MIRQKIFRRIALLITNLIISSLIILVVFSIIEQRRQINNYILSNGQVFANGLERLILWDDIYAIEKSLDILLESDSFYRYILVINENELYAESCVCKGLKSDKLLNMVSENPAKPYTWTFEDEEGRVFFEGGYSCPEYRCFSQDWNGQENDRPAAPRLYFDNTPDRLNSPCCGDNFFTQDS